MVDPYVASVVANERARCSRAVVVTPRAMSARARVRSPWSSSTTVARARRTRARGGRARAASPNDAAWRGTTPKQSTLPLDANGDVDYRSIDRSIVSKVLTRTIRGLLVREVGADNDETSWEEFKGTMTAVREVNDMRGSARDVQLRAKRVFAGILPELGIGFVPPLWKKYIKPNAPEWMANYAFVLVFTNLFPWLMGPMEGVDHVDVKTPDFLRKTFRNLPESIKVPQSVKAERCRFLETSQCASVCVNSCKAPSQEWLAEDFGMDLHIQPNYDDFSCQWKFSVKPPPLYEDAAIMVPCFSKCPSEYKGEKDAFRQAARVARGFGVVDGVDTYTGETLEAIAKRASEAAKADASVFADGTAIDALSFASRADDVKSSGKCWSVDESRAVMSTVARDS